MRTGRGTKIIAALCLACLAGSAVIAAIRTPALDVFEESTGRRIWCAADPVAGTLSVRYLSRNSIYGATAEETWLVSADGVQIERVRSVPVVLDYYGITNYRVLPDGSAEGVPVVSFYSDLRLKASPRGEQRLLAGSAALDISASFAEGAVLVARPRSALRIAPCALP